MAWKKVVSRAVVIAVDGERWRGGRAVDGRAIDEGYVLL